MPWRLPLTWAASDGSSRRSYALDVHDRYPERHIVGIQRHQPLAEPGQEPASLLAAHLGEQGLLVELRQERDIAIDRERVFQGRWGRGHVPETGTSHLGGRAQISLRPVDRWPELAGFQGTVQWRVTFPAADRYEPRTLSGLQLQFKNDL